MREIVLPLDPRFDPKRQRLVATWAAQLAKQTWRLKKGVEGLDPDALEWQPAPGMNSIGMLLAHIAITEVYWVNIAPAELPEEPDGQEVCLGILGIRLYDDGMPLSTGGRHPDAIRGKVLDDYFAILDAAREATLKVLDTWKDMDLDETFENDGDRVARAWTLYHVLEHLAYHHGQVGLVRRLREASG